MIFPKECKFVGNASTSPLGERVYFLTQYLVRPTSDGLEVLKIQPKDGHGLMREIESVELIAGPKDIAIWEGKVTTHDRADLVKKALSTKKKCTIFGKEDEHMTFVFEPDLAEFRNVHVYDITPPNPTLADTINKLDKLGFFETEMVSFDYHIRDIRLLNTDVYPCRAGGFSTTLDRDVPPHGAKIACCRTGRQICHENYGTDFEFEDTCPITQINAEPFITRCCRADEGGIGEYNGYFGAVVHWGANPKTIADAFFEMMKQWRERNG